MDPSPLFFDPFFDPLHHRTKPPLFFDPRFQMLLVASE
jgi:hypothetical protein